VNPRTIRMRFVARLEIFVCYWYRAGLLGVFAVQVISEALDQVIGFSVSRGFLFKLINVF